jgi:hypothetical protein
MSDLFFWCVRAGVAYVSSYLYIYTYMMVHKCRNIREYKKSLPLCAILDDVKR